MGEKLYRVKLKNGEHLVHSRKNPKNVRGVSRDENNKNPDIPEFEEVDADDFENQYYQSNSASDSSESEEVHFSPEEEVAFRILGDAPAQIIMTEGGLLLHQVIIPWWKNKAWPSIKRQGRRFLRRKSIGQKDELQPQQVDTLSANQRVRLYYSRWTKFSKWTSLRQQSM